MSDAQTNELLQLNQRLLDSIAGADWATYEELCDPSLTAFEPEAQGQLIEGLAFTSFNVHRSSVPFLVASPATATIAACTGAGAAALLEARRAVDWFVGTGLESALREAGHTILVIAGVITNNSVEATVRMAGDLGFETYVVADACFTFARKDWDGRDRTADEVHAMSLESLPKRL